MVSKRQIVDRHGGRGGTRILEGKSSRGGRHQKGHLIYGCINVITVTF